MVVISNSRSCNYSRSWITNSNSNTSSSRFHEKKSEANTSANPVAFATKPEKRPNLHSTGKQYEDWKI